MSKVRKMEKLRIGLRIVFYEEADFWVAHCLEMNVMGHERQKGKALENLIEAMALQIGSSIEAKNHANIFMPADARFFEMYAAGQDVAEGECIVEEMREFIRVKDEITIQGIETREYRPAMAMA